MSQSRTIAVDGLNIFYREAGDPAAPVVLLLHGFPTSSHQFRHLIPRLADRYRVVAPDLPGFGFSDMPDRETFAYNFEALTDVIDRFTSALGIDRYALYVFDYGAPVGLRLALRHPERVTALITQNGNAYLDGISAAFNPIAAYWQAPTAANRAALKSFLTAATTQFQYREGAHDASAIAPEAYTLDQARLDRPGNDEIQLDLFLDYQTNVALYPAFQEYFRTHRPPTLAVWGRNDPFFIPAGAEAFRRDNPATEIHFVDGGHFPLETKLDEIVGLIRDFLGRTLDRAGAAAFADVRYETVPAASRTLLDKTAEIFGFIPNLAVKMGADPAALEAYLTGLTLYGRTASLTAIEQQLVMIAASAANEAAYSIAVHSTVARQLGADDKLIASVASGQPLADARLSAVIDLTNAMVRHRGQVSDAVLDRAKAAGLGADAIVGVAFGVMLKSFANTLALIAKPAIDPGFAAEA